MKVKESVLFLFSFFVCSLIIAQEVSNLDYHRSSLYTIMLSDDLKENHVIIENTFKASEIPEKFNNHITGLRVIPVVELENDSNQEASTKEKKGLFSKLPKLGNNKKGKDEKLQGTISNFLNTNAIAKSIVSKWFNRSDSGGFNMDLISARGFYDASDLDIKIAKNKERGLALLADAGEQLINNTFVIVNDFRYTNKEEVASKTKGILNQVSTYAGGDLSTTAELASAGVEVMGKGYVVKTRAFLYKLVWNEEIAATFYNDFWTEDGAIDLDRKQAFDDTDIFSLEFIGAETAWADVQSTILTKKSNDELIALATIRAVDNVIAKLQRKYEVFRTKSPLLSGEPIAAKIGLKEGLKKGDKYEVLEQVLNKEGITEYKRVGVIKVDKTHIWDNRFGADELSETDFEYTTFTGSKKKYFAGMLIRQIN